MDYLAYFVLFMAAGLRADGEQMDCVCRYGAAKKGNTKIGLEQRRLLCMKVGRWQCEEEITKCGLAGVFYSICDGWLACGL